MDGPKLTCKDSAAVLCVFLPIEFSYNEVWPIILKKTKGFCLERKWYKLTYQILFGIPDENQNRRQSKSKSKRYKVCEKEQHRNPSAVAPTRTRKQQQQAHGRAVGMRKDTYKCFSTLSIQTTILISRLILTEKSNSLMILVHGPSKLAAFLVTISNCRAQ